VKISKFSTIIFRFKILKINSFVAIVQNNCPKNTGFNPLKNQRTYPATLKNIIEPVWAHNHGFEKSKNWVKKPTLNFVVLP
jgi:hypothetical protein